MSISRTASAELLAHLQLPVTTTCRLLKITTSAGDIFGLATLDRTITYDDGDGELDYIATNGFDPSTIAAQIGTTVANAVTMQLMHIRKL